jgi:hypothetical protein
MDFPAANIITVEEEVVKMTEVEVTLIVTKLANLVGCHDNTALSATAEMIRKGGANNSTPMNFSVGIKCPQENHDFTVVKRDVIRIIQIVCPNKTFRNLADTLAENIIAAGLKNVSQYPDKDFGGDLAKKISIRLAFTNRDPLTPAERVGCASYAQHIPHLDSLVGSNRLQSLLAEDLQLRRTSADRKKSPKKTKIFGQNLPKNTVKKGTNVDPKVQQTQQKPKVEKRDTTKKKK